MAASPAAAAAAALLALLALAAAGGVAADGSDHRYKAGEPVPLYANKVGPFHNPSETYRYFDLPFCSTERVKEKSEALGEVLNGDRLVDAPYKLDFRVDLDSKSVCSKKLTTEDVAKFWNAVAKDYYFQMYYDDLPLWGFIGKVEKGGKADPSEWKYYLYRHIIFDILFNNDRVIEINVHTDQSALVDLTEDKETNVDFLYSVKWKETDTPFEKRMEKYSSSSNLPHHLEVHWFSIINSCVTVLLLTGFLATILMRVLKNDFVKEAFSASQAPIYMNQAPPHMSRPSIILKLILGLIWGIIHFAISLFNLWSLLIYNLECYIISSGLLRRYRYLHLDRLKYLAIVVDSKEAKNTVKIRQLLCWLSTVGVKYICLYDIEGVLKKSFEPAMKGSRDGKAVEYLGTSTSISHTSHKDLAIECLSGSDGKEGIAKAANLLCSTYLNGDTDGDGKTEPKFTEADMASALKAVGCGGPEPDLLLMYGPARCHLGFPAWRLRYTEIMHMGSLKSMKYGAIVKALYNFSKKHQNYERWGKEGVALNHRFCASPDAETPRRTPYRPRAKRTRALPTRRRSTS